MKLIIDIEESKYKASQKALSICGRGDENILSNYLINAVAEGTPLEAQSTEVINKIPEDYVYDTETDEFEVYRHKYTGKEIHITKEPKLYKLEAQPTGAVSKYILVNAVRECQKFQPCEDIVSRSESIKKFNEVAYPIVHGINNHDKGLTLTGIEQVMNEMPPVQPDRPKGKWIEIEIDAGEFIYKCTKCGMRVINPYKYCPICGSYNGGEEDAT